MRKVYLLIILFFLFLFPPVAHAQAGEEIRQYDTTIQVQKDGALVVQERIYYVFSQPRHGIYRTLPLATTAENGKKYKVTVDELSVTDDRGVSYPYTTTYIDDTMQLKIGDAAKTISGAHMYIISYRVMGAIRYFPGHDELYWNWIGNTWDVPIRASSVRVTLPDTVASTDVHADCFTGVLGATEKNCTVQTAQSFVSGALTKGLRAYEGGTIVIGFPKGIVAVVEPKEVVPFTSTIQGKATVIAIIVVALFWYLALPIWIIVKWWRKGRDPKSTVGEAHVWFSPPKTRGLRELTPGETGALIDEVVHTRDIYATVVDLARRGYIKIIETKKDVFELKKTKEWLGDPALLLFEKSLLIGMFGKKDSVALKDLTLASTFETVKKYLYDTLVKDEFFPENPSSVRSKYYILAFFAFVTGNILLTLIAAMFGSYMPRKTVFGVNAANVARSLKQFLASQDKKLKFQAEKQMMFEKLLPYAIAFGVEDVWAKRFADAGISQPEWYESHTSGHFSSTSFAYSMGHGMTVSFSQSITYSSTKGYSSGFSSGGGFSGGGGGGGGGGSW